jgi:A/G-specific adenine glycosylase
VTTVADPRLRAVLRWWDADARDLPWRRTRDVYAVWVSEVMLIQTQVERVVPVFEAWIDRWPDVERLADARLAEVLEQWQGLGYPRRARDLHRAARVIVASGWPDDLTELPGIGAYVSAAVRCFAREEPVLPVDVNVGRVLRRRFGDHVDISADPWRAGQALMEFGQRVCTARPRCGMCPVQDGCPGPAVDPAPRASRDRRFEGSLRQRRGQLLRRVLADGVVPAADVDPAAAAGLVADGLIRRCGAQLLAPG